VQTLAIRKNATIAAPEAIPQAEYLVPFRLVTGFGARQAHEVPKIDVARSATEHFLLAALRVAQSRAQNRTVIGKGNFDFII